MRIGEGLRKTGALGRFLADRGGATCVEYGPIAVLVAVGMLAA